jgi:hypothetical protein
VLHVLHRPGHVQRRHQVDHAQTVLVPPGYTRNC